jgi:hypothetical protein
MNDEILEDLKEKLGSESAGQWMRFMFICERHLSFLFSGSGAPKKSTIEKSIIGKAGFLSWSDYVQNGLNWNLNSWKSWKKAWSIVKQNDYLRSLPITASEINTMAAQHKPFPASLDEYQAVKEGRQSVIADKRQNSVAALKTQLTSSESDIASIKLELASSNAKVELLTAEKSKNEEKINSLIVSNESLKIKHAEELKKEIESRKKITKSLNTLKNKGFFARLFNLK